MLSIPKGSSPTCDSSGKNSYQNQNFPDVFFLCQTVEGSEIIPSRTLSICSGRSIFMPIINWISISLLDGETDDELRTVAKRKMDKVANLDFVINGLHISGTHKDFRVSSPAFEAILPDDNIFGVLPGQRRFVSDGFWIFLKPVSKAISLSSFGSCSSGITKIGVNYDLSIQP